MISAANTNTNTNTNTKSGQPLSGLIPKEDSSTMTPPTVYPVTSDIRAEMEHLVKQPTTIENAYNDTPEYRASLEKIVKEPIRELESANHSDGSSHALGSLDFSDYL